MPKWHKIRRKKPIFGAILCQNGTRLMPKWHSQNACMSNFLPLVAKRRGSGEKRGCASPLLGMVWQQAATMGFPHLAGEPSTLVSMALAAVRTCAHNKQALSPHFWGSVATSCDGVSAGTMPTSGHALPQLVAVDCNGSPTSRFFVQNARTSPRYRPRSEPLRRSWFNKMHKAAPAAR